MDPFTQRMLERAKARRQKLDEQLANAGQTSFAGQTRKSPLKELNSFALQNPVDEPIVTKSSRRVSSTPEKNKKISATPEKNKKNSATPEKNKKSFGTPEKKKITREITPDKENGAQTVSTVRNKASRVGQFYSDDNRRELRTENKFTVEQAITDGKTNVKRSGARLDRLAALASTINNWEDDLSHPSLVVNQSKKGESKAEKIQAKMNEQVKAAPEPQPSTSGFGGRWKSNMIKWDQKVLDNLEAQGFTRSKSNSRLIYDYEAFSQESKENSNTTHDQVQGKNLKKKEGSIGSDVKAQSTCRSPSSTKTPEKTTKTVNSTGGRNRFGGYNGSPKSTIQSPGSVLSTASLFEKKSLANKVKDPAEMSLSERMALFEKNKGEALIPKAPLTLSVPTKKLMETKKSSSNIHEDRTNVRSGNKPVTTSRNLFELGLPKQELENDILRDCQAERQKELDMLRCRFNKNKEGAQAAAGSCIRPRNNSETNTGSPKNSPVCPVKPTPATVNHISTDHVPPPPPLPNYQCSQSPGSMQPRSSPAKRQVTKTPPKSSSNSQQASQPKFANVKRIRVSPPKTGNLYPDLTSIESTTESEYTVGTSEPETATLDSKTPTEPDTDNSSHDYSSNSTDDINTSFETSVLRVVARQNLPNKRQIETDLESSSSDISVLDEMDEYLDECLANQESQSSHGPTPPKLNRAAGSPSMTSNSFKYTQGTSYRSPIVITPSRSPRKQDYLDGESQVPLMHSVSLYRRQQSQTPKTPVRQITRPDNSASHEKMTMGDKYEAKVVQEKIKHLMEEVCKQQTIIGQASQALNLCTATVEFSGSREQVEGERLLLVATHRRQAALNEIQRLKVEGSLRPAVPGASEVQESGSLTISAITLPLRRDHRNNDADVCLHFLALVRHLNTVIATPVVQAELNDSCVRFPATLKLDELYSDFKITIEIYSFETRAEVLPHEVKYHIHSAGHSGSGNGTKKGGNKTPKKFFKQESRLLMPHVQSPAGPSAVRSPAFLPAGYVVFSLREVNRQQFTLNKVPRNSCLEGHLQMHVGCELSVSVEHHGFLTMFEDISGFGAWHRRWCLLKGDTLSYWKYPDDERKKTPIGSLELQGVVTTQVGVVSRDICARPHTFLLETVRPAQSGEPESLIVVRNGSVTTIRHLLSADTKEERLEWCSKLNQTLSLIRAWGGTGASH